MPALQREARPNRHSPPPLAGRWVFAAPFLAGALVLILQSQRSEAFALCKTTAKADNCLHGTTKDYCGNMVCAKGPGDRCGGPSDVHGRCGEGMHCKCEVCSGCSVETLDCHLSRATCF